MADWKRTTREIPFDSFPPELAVAINNHIEQYNLGSILSDALMCIQTDSEKIKKGFLGGAETVRLGAVLTPRWLLWAVIGSNTPTSVLSTLLTNITVQDYAQTPFATMAPDSGIEVKGMFTDANEPASAFLGLDQGMAGQKFKDMVIKATQDAKK